jgi:GNAT superfamily N-acetyltransferase
MNELTFTAYLNPCPDSFDQAEWEVSCGRELRAYLNGRLAGWLAYFPCEEDGAPNPCIRKLVVYPGYQRQGIATAIMDRFAELHPGEIVVGTYLPDGRKFFDAWYAGRTDVHRFIETEQVGA